MINLKTKLGVSLLLAASVSMAQASTYDVSATFSDGGVQGKTFFNGSFNWDGTSVTNFTGDLTESMWAWNVATSSWTSGFNGTGSTTNNPAYLGAIYAKPGGYAQNEAPLLHMAFDTLVPTTTSGGLVTAMTFLQNSTDVVFGGGYDVSNTTGTPMAFGMGVQANRNNNGFFTLVFDAANPTNTSAVWDKTVYADETRLGMMGPLLTGWMGMTGFGNANDAGSMGGFPTALSITAAPAAVPLPAAVWLFGAGLMGLFGANRRKHALTA
jgi:hypothetical protein